MKMPKGQALTIKIMKIQCEIVLPGVLSKNVFSSILNAIVKVCIGFMNTAQNKGALYRFNRLI